MINRPEIIGETWYNTPHPITPEEMEDRIVLVDFFTYSCVNCIRTIPYLQKIWRRYKYFDFFIIGIHTPEFEFEKKPENVALALKMLRIDWPVVLDNEYVNWRNFANHYWPAHYLFNRNGKLVFEHFGEGKYAELEERIQEVFAQDFRIVNLPKIEADEGTVGSFCFIATPELYCGTARGRIANLEGYHEGHLGVYKRPSIIPPNMIALSGQFDAQDEYVETFLSGAEILINFTATEVNLVMAPADDGFGIVEILFNDEPIPQEISGRDVDRGDVVLTEDRMYNLFRSDRPVSGILKVRAKQSNFRAYAFTFSGCGR